MNDIAESSKIVDITSVIDGIAFQTNIPGMNVAEAAHAGEQGRDSRLWPERPHAGQP